MGSELFYRGHEEDEITDQQTSSHVVYTPKPKNKPLLLVTRPLRYLLQEQRLIFVFIGIVIATLIFALLPSSPSPLKYENHNAFIANTYFPDLEPNLILSQKSNVYHENRGGMPLKYENHNAFIGNTYFPDSEPIPILSQKSNAYHENRGGMGMGMISAGGKIPLGLKSKGLRIVVTGGAGFVGSHLVDRLISRGDSVIVVDNFFTGRKENVMHHLRNPRFELIRHDVVEPLLLEVDQIYHLACPASPVHYKFNPIKTIKTNVVGTLNMLGLAKRIGARFLLTSTSEVYGDPLQHPQVETYWGNVNPIGVRSCYDEGKRTAETLTMDYHRGAGVEVRIARIFNTYGPRMGIDDGRVVSNFVAQALRKEPMTVYGDGKQTRSFQYVSDLVEGLMKLMEGEHVGPFNLGNPGEFTMMELAQVVQETIDPNAKIEYRPNTEDDPHKRKPDISKAKELLGWEPAVSLSKGLPLMVSDFRQRIFGDHKDAADISMTTTTS